MERDDFDETVLGEIVPTTTPKGTYSAFRPDPLPPSISTEQLITPLAEAMRASIIPPKGCANAHGQPSRGIINSRIHEYDSRSFHCCRADRQWHFITEAVEQGFYDTPETVRLPNWRRASTSTNRR